MERAKLIVYAVYTGIVLGVGLAAWSVWTESKPILDRVTQSQANLMDAQAAEIEQRSRQAAERPEITQEMYYRQVQQAKEASERVAELEAQLAPEPESEPEPEPVTFVDCNRYQRIQTEEAAGAKVAPCGGAYYGSDPGLVPLNGWNDQPKKDEPGVIRTNLRVACYGNDPDGILDLDCRGRRPLGRTTLAPGVYTDPALGRFVVGPDPQLDPKRPRTYRGDYGTVTVHPSK